MSVIILIYLGLLLLLLRNHSPIINTQFRTNYMSNQIQNLEVMKGVKEFPTHKANPYVHNLVIPSRNKTIAISNRQLNLFDPKTGEVEENNIGFMGIRKRVDTEEFVKIFKGQIQALFDLSNRALKVFGYLMDATRISSDTVIFDLDECKEYTGYKSKNSITLAIAELLEKQFVARTSSHYKYYINPAKFFNGDRMVLFQDIVRKGSKVDQNLLENDPLLELNQQSIFDEENSNS